MIIFHSPLLLMLLPLVIAVLWVSAKKDRSGGFIFSSEQLVSDIKPSIKVFLSGKLIYVRIFAACLIVLALSRPQTPIANSRIDTEGIDIVLCLDSSTSMLAEDFKVNGVRESRIDIIKDVVSKFIESRKDDRLALVTFAARAYTVCPLTLDQGWLLSNLVRVKAGMVEDGTAIGSGISASLNRLKNSKAKSKVIILLTDGRNNRGTISPLTAAEAAKALKVKVYTIGAGSKGPIPYPVQDMFGNKAYTQIEADLDEDLLKQIADITGANYYRATDTESLQSIYKDIDRLEKTKIQEKGYEKFNELFPLFLVPGLLVLLMEIILTNTGLRRIP